MQPYYRLLALDLDGTAVIAGKMPTAGVRAAVRRAESRGVTVVIATGRAFASALPYALALRVSSPLVCFQGALVKEQGGEQSTLFTDPAPARPLAEVARWAEDRVMEFSIYTEQSIYLSRMYHSQAFYDLWFGLPVIMENDLVATIARLDDAGIPLIKGLFTGDPATNTALVADLRPLLGGKLAMVRSHDLFLEVLSPSASKGRALALLADRFGVGQAETIAVGDSENDLSMVRWAGLGVAMANAAPELLSIADWVAPTVAEDGVAAVVDRFLCLNGRHGSVDG